MHSVSSCPPILYPAQTGDSYESALFSPSLRTSCSALSLGCVFRQPDATRRDKQAREERGCLSSNTATRGPGGECLTISRGAMQSKHPRRILWALAICACEAGQSQVGSAEKRAIRGQSRGTTAKLAARPSNECVCGSRCKSSVIRTSEYAVAAPRARSPERMSRGSSHKWHGP